MSEQLDIEIIEMDSLLRQAAQVFTYPPTPSMAPAVEARLRKRARWARLTSPQAHVAALMRGLLQSLGGWGRRPTPRIAMVGLAVALVVVGTVLAIPQSRTALADFFGLGHVRVRTESTLPNAERPVLRPEDFAEPLTLEVAQRLADFQVRLPTYPDGVGAPDNVYLQTFGDDNVIIAVYQAEGFDLYQSRLRGFFGKVVRVSASQLEVAGAPGLWIPKGGHQAVYLDADGEEVPGSQRNVERATLLWEEDGITYRLETSLPQEGTIRVAESLR